MALTNGPLAGLGKLPLVASNSARSIERVRNLLGDDTDIYMTRGASMMNYDELTQYAIRHLDPRLLACSSAA